MKLIPITHIPEKPNKHNKATEFLIEFMMSGEKYAIVSYTNEEYATGASLYAVLFNAAKTNGLPIKVHRRGEKVYLEKL